MESALSDMEKSVAQKMVEFKHSIDDHPIPFCEARAVVMDFIKAGMKVLSPAVETTVEVHDIC